MGELLEKYVEMSEGKQKSAAEPTKAMEPLREPLGANKRIVISEDAESEAIARSRGTKRKRYAGTGYSLSVTHLHVAATRWITQTKKTVWSPHVKYPTPKSVLRAMQRHHVKSQIHPQSSPQNQPTHALFLILQFALSSAHHRSPICRDQSHH